MSSLANGYRFVKTIVDWDTIAKMTHNQFEVVSSRKYTDSKGILPDGYTLTLKVLHDDFDYGVNSDGEKIDNNVGQNFDVTVLSRAITVHKFDIVSEYSCAAEPPVQCSVSHLSRRSEPQ